MSQKKRRSQRQTHLNDHPAEEWALPLDARWRPGYDISQVLMASLCAGLSLAWPLRSPDRVLRPGEFCGIIRLDFIHLSSHINFTRLTKTEATCLGGYGDAAWH